MSLGLRQFICMIVLCGANLMIYLGSLSRTNGELTDRLAVVTLIDGTEV